MFESELLDRGIGLINARPYHPQTNGKIERFFRTLETEFVYYNDMRKYIDHYNEERLHWSLDIDNYETPMKAFHNKKVPEGTYSRTSHIRRENYPDVDAIVPSFAST